MPHDLVVHCKRSPFDVYIGRGQNSIWGNPFSHLAYAMVSARGLVGTREEAVARFESWLKGETDKTFEQHKREQILKHLPDLKGKKLGCWCAPQACHGDVLARMANA